MPNFDQSLNLTEGIWPSPAAEALWEKRYRHDNEGPNQTFRRVANEMADPNIHDQADVFYRMMVSMRFLPNTPTLINAGRNKGGTYSACFVLVPEDSMSSILDMHTVAGTILKGGGGVGYSFSRLREAGAPISTTRGKARGPIGAMAIFQELAGFIEQAGARDGAQMAVLHCDHPDIEDFISLKNENPQRWNSFNISVAATDEWMKYQAAEWDRGDPPHPKGILWKMAQNAHKTGDPGCYFIDAAERQNPTPHLGTLESTNPCGEVPMLPFEACNLGSLCLWRYWRGEIAGDEQSNVNHHEWLDWTLLEQDVRNAIRFLDAVVDKGEFPDPRVKEIMQGNRKIGLGVMGWADLLALLQIPYDSVRAVKLGGIIASFIKLWADDASQKLAEEKGPYPNFNSSSGATGPAIRNATRLCIAPTGSISILAGASGGIEPHFALEYEREMGDGTKFMMTEPALEHTDFVPKVANDISWEWHIAHQVAWQEHIDLAVSKTINMPESATVEDVYNAYVMAWKKGCKGITVYRNKSREQQVLTSKADNTIERVVDLVDAVGDALDGIADGPSQSMAAHLTDPDHHPNHSHRERLPHIRNAKIHKFSIEGEDGYFIIGEYPDGRMGEVFIVMNREGSAARGWADLAATFISISIQHGVDIDLITDKLKGTRFPPSGLTGDPTYPAVASVPDLLGHIMEVEYMGHDVGSSHITGDWCPDCGTQLVHESSCAVCKSCGYEKC